MPLHWDNASSVIKVRVHAHDAQGHAQMAPWQTAHADALGFRWDFDGISLGYRGTSWYIVVHRGISLGFRSCEVSGEQWDIVGISLGYRWDIVGYPNDQPPLASRVHFFFLC